MSNLIWYNETDFGILKIWWKSNYILNLLDKSDIIIIILRIVNNKVHLVIDC